MAVSGRAYTILFGGPPTLGRKEPCVLFRTLCAICLIVCFGTSFVLGHTLTCIAPCTLSSLSLNGVWRAPNRVLHLSVILCLAGRVAALSTYAERC